MAATQLGTEFAMDRSHFLSVLLGILKDHLGEVLGPEQYDADLTELGVDSLMAIEVAHHLEEELGIVIDDRDALGFRTVNAICATLQRCPADPVCTAQGIAR
jgi:acyl carrier protein